MDPTLIENLIQMSILANHKNNKLVTTLLEEFIDEIEPYHKELKYKNGKKTWDIYWSRERLTYINKGFKMDIFKKQKGRIKVQLFEKELVCFISTKEKHENEFTVKLSFLPDTLDRARDWCSRLFTIQHLFFDNKVKVNRYVPKSLKKRVSKGHVKKGWSYKKHIAWNYDGNTFDKRLSNKRFRRLEKILVRTLQTDPEELILIPEKRREVSPHIGKYYFGELYDENIKDPTKDRYKRK